MSTTAFVFPGQGSQSLGMLKDLASKSSIVEQTFSEASESLSYDLWDLIQNDPNQELNQTQFTQPALLTASVAAYRVFVSENDTRPAFLAGHSLGEYSALTCANVFALQDAVKLVEARGNFMQQAVPHGTGAMYAIIGLDDELIIQACETAANETKEIVSAVNFNSPGQVVIAGTSKAAETAAALCKEAGAKRALPLAVSVPSHCELMQPAAQRLAEALDALSMKSPELSVVNNVDVAIESDVTNIKNALVRQLHMPVRWTESVRFLVEKGVDTVIEIGPGKVLSGLNKRIDKSLTLQNFG